MSVVKINGNGADGIKRASLHIRQRHRAVLLESIARMEVAFEVEVVVDRGVARSKFLQRLGIPIPGHGAFTSFERLMRILSPVIEPSSTFLAT